MINDAETATVPARLQIVHKRTGVLRSPAEAGTSARTGGHAKIFEDHRRTTFVDGKMTPNRQPISRRHTP